MKNYINIIAILFIMACCNHKESANNNRIEESIINVFINDNESKSYLLKNTNWKKELIAIKKSYVIENNPIKLYLHSLSSLCGDCWDYRLIHIEGSGRNNYIIPINDEIYYSELNNYNGGDKNCRTRYNRSNIKLEKNLNYFFASDSLFKNFSFNDSSKVYHLNSFMTVFVDTILLEGNKFNNRLSIKDTSDIKQRMNRYKEIKDKKIENVWSVDSLAISKAQRDLNEVLANLKNSNRNTRYYNYYGSIYEFVFLEESGILTVKVNLLNEDFFSIMRF